MGFLSDRIDGFLSIVSPGWALSRKQSRDELSTYERDREFKETLRDRRRDRMLRAFDGSGSGDRLREWNNSTASPNDILEDELEDLWLHAEELYRNNPYIASAVDGRVKYVVGNGFTLNANVDTSLSTGEVDEEGDRNRSKNIERLFRKWAIADDFVEKQRECERSHGIYGEILIVMSSLSDDDYDPSEHVVPLTIQVINPKRLEQPPELEGDENVRLGIRFHPEYKTPTHYYIRRHHPDDTKNAEVIYDEIPAHRVIHLFEKKFPGQVRGYPWVSPVMNQTRDLQDYEEAHLIGEQVAACSAAFVTSSDGNTAAAGARSQGQLEDIAPGKIHYLNEDETVQFSNPNRPGGTFGLYVNTKLRAIAAGLDYPFELLAKTYENSYSGGRLATIDGRMTFRVWQDIQRRGMRRIYRRWLDMAILLDALDEDAWEHYVEEKDTYRTHEWHPPKWPWVDPLQEVRADSEAISSDIGTISQSLADRGFDYESHIRVREREMMDRVERDARVAARAAKLEIEHGLAPGSLTGFKPDSEEEIEADPKKGGTETSTETETELVGST